jgi:uncharacterized membrane protein
MAKLLPCAVALSLIVACGDARSTSAGQQPDGGGAFGAFGPRTNTTTAECTAAGLTGLTYADFAQGFFGAYCVQCHSVTKTGAARNGAPTDRNFDTLTSIQPWSDEIDQVAAMSPDGKVRNVTMPFLPPDPPDGDRQRLACWIAAGLP